MKNNCFFMFLFITTCTLLVIGCKSSKNTSEKQPIESKLNISKNKHLAKKTHQPKTKIPLYEKQITQPMASSAEGCLEILLEGANTKNDPIKHLFAYAVAAHAQGDLSKKNLSKNQKDFVRIVWQGLKFLDSIKNDVNLQKTNPCWNIIESAFLSYEGLIIDDLKLCKSVTNRTTYKVLNSLIFGKGRKTQAVIFLPIRKLLPEILKTGKIKTSVSLDIEIVDSEGLVVQNQDPVFLTEIQDKYTEKSFVATLITFSHTLKKGKYMLNAKLKDEIGLKTVTKSMTFTINDQPI